MINMHDIIDVKAAKNKIIVSIYDRVNGNVTI